jgi:signal transduction histidine kinase
LGVLVKLGTLQPLEQIAYRVLFQVRGALPWDERLVLVAIDDASVRQLGWFPWSRQEYVKLLNLLSEANASVVVFDLIWSESSPDDAQLAEAIMNQGRVVLSHAWDAAGLPLFPVPELKQAAITTGHILKHQEEDGLVRNILPQLGGQSTLSIAAIQAYSLVQAPISLPPPDRPLWLNWLGPTDQLAKYSFIDVIQGNVLPAAFQDKIVLVGVTATGIDPLTTPFDKNSPASSVHLHATAISNLLQQNYLHPLDRGWRMLLLFLGGPGLSWLITGWSTRRQIIIVIGLCLVWGVVSLVLFYHYYLPTVVFPILLFVCTGGTTALSERLRENILLQRQIAQLWYHYHQDLVLRAQESDHPLIQPQGQELQQPASPMLRVAQLAALAEQFGRSQSTQAAIARSLSISLLAADLDGTVWFCNPTAAEWLEIQTGQNLNQRLIPEWLTLEQWQIDLEQLQLGNPSQPRELNRHGRWFELRLEPLVYPSYASQAARQEDLSGLLLLLEDIGDRKQVEAQLNQQIQELHKISLLKDDFLSTVSHELRAPMANMKMAIHMLEIAQSQEVRDQYLRILREECARETELINDLLDLQRLEAGAKELKLEMLTLSDWLPKLVEPFYSRAATRQQSLHLELAPDLPLLQSDPSSLRRLMTELINNACKYTPPDHKITIHITHHSSNIKFQISNSGIEIPPTELDKIFDKFYRVPSGDRWKQGGTGLGLALVKRLTEHLGGTIHVESQAELTTFTLRLPID